MKHFSLLFTALLATTALWAADFEVDGIAYNIADAQKRTVEVTYKSPSYSGAITIPSSVTYNSMTYSVTSIGEYAFYWCTSLTSITIPNSVTSIGDAAFSNCTSITSITIPNSVISIGGSAFSGCSSLPVENNLRYADTYLIGAVDKTLSTYTIKEGTKWIGSYAFSKCTSLTSITIPNSVTSIGVYAFYWCSSLTSITIPNSVTSIEYGAFSKCTSLTSITIPNSVTSIGNCAFYSCTSLTSITIPDIVTSIGYEVFEGCTALPVVDNLRYADTYLIGAVDKTLSTYTIKEGTKWIGNTAFSKCPSLKSITIPNSVTSIEGQAFHYCESLTSITIPNSVTSIGNGAFNNCRSLTSITIPNSVTSIGDFAFYDCTSLTSITIPNSVTSIGYSAFSGCRSLTSIDVDASNTHYASVDGVLFNYAKDTLMQYPIGNTSTTYTIPNSVTSIKGGAFSWCTSLTSITIPNSVISIGNSAFSGCTSLTSITIPNSVTSIGDRAFEYCKSLTSVNVDAANTHYTSTDGVLFTYAKDTLIQYPIGNKRTSYTIPNSVTSIEGLAFYYCKSLDSIACYATTPPICGVFCFQDVDKSIPLYVPKNSITAYQQADQWRDFTNFKPLIYGIVTTSVNNPLYGSVSDGGIQYDTICTITATANYYYQFMQWSDGNTDNPRSIVVTQDTTFEAWFDIAKSGTCGDDLIWQYSQGTLTITGTGDMYNYTQDSVPWIFIRDSITSIVIDNGATSVGDYAFYACANKNFKTVELPNSVTIIGQYAFANCTYLKNLALGTGVEEIGAKAFDNDQKLIYVTCYAMEPPTLATDGFSKWNAYLKVPCEALADYKVSDGWEKFTKENIQCIGAESTTTTTVTVTATVNTATITWPTDANADSYSIEVKKGDEVFCTLTFNAQGQLTNIAFAPDRGTSSNITMAEAVAGGYRFTITGLDAGTKYTYEVDTQDANGTTIANYTGSFSTTGGGTPTTLNETSFPSGEDRGEASKFLHNGHLYIQHNNHTYTPTGQEL